ncbi:MAG: S1 family peptidase [Vicinamibacteria bacterium]
MLFTLRIPIALAVLAPAPSHALQVPPTEEVFRKFSDHVVKIEVQETGSAAKASIGSGFFVSPGGHLVTNYHVIAQVVQHPDRYRASLVRGDEDETTPIEVLNVDAAHDLAIVKSGEPAPAHFTLEERNTLQGVRLYSLGHPLDLGLNIVEGTYNGFLKHALDQRIHFTGSLNPGMSGGPAITSDGKVIGVNVATAGDQVSFLVPVKWAATLLQETLSTGFLPGPLLERVRLQILDYQDRFLSELLSRPPPKVKLGGFELPTKPAPYFNCWADATREEKMEYESVDHQCSTDDYIFVSDELVSGELWFYHRLLESDRLNRFQFAALYTEDFGTTYHGMEGSESEVTPFQCHSGTVREGGLTFKSVFCLRRYRKLEALYDLVFKAAVVGRPLLGLESALMASGVSFENAERLVRWYMDGISWSE